MDKLILNKPVEIDGEVKKEIEYDLDSLTAVSIEQTIKSLAKRQHIVVVQESDIIFHAALFAEAAQIDYTDVQRFSGKDMLKAGRLVRDFFFLDSEDGLVENTSDE